MSNLVKNFIGSDISKLTIDVAVIVNGIKDKIYYRQFKKNEGFKLLIQWLLSLGVTLDKQTVFCMEFTGLYNRSIVEFLSKYEIILWLEMPFHIKSSLGLTRGKSDKIDAKRIAEFAYKNRDEIKEWVPLDQDIQKLKDLLVQRDRLIESKLKLQVPLKEIKQEGMVKQAAELEKLQKQAIDGIEKSLLKVEKLIRKIIDKDGELKKITNHLKSIVGIGEIIAWHFIVYTNGFKRLKNGKQLACYCGVAPFGIDSGTSIKKKPRVNHFANKKLKTLLQMGALSAIVHDPELKAYYQRKVSEGKNPMGTLNAVRNKLISRMVAVVRDDRDYVKGDVNNAA